MQKGVIAESEPYGLGLNEKLLPQYLKELGYSTHIVDIVGKVAIFAWIRILLTFVIGMQTGVCYSSQPYGLGLDQKLLPQYLKELGYATHIVGKVRRLDLMTALIITKISQI